MTSLKFVAIQILIVLIAVPKGIFWRCAAWSGRLETMLSNEIASNE